MIYLIVFIFFLIGIIVFDRNNKEGNRYYWFLCVLLILLWGLRYHVGGDSLRYENHFSDYPLLSELHNFDFTYASYQPLWYIYNSFLKTICDSFTFFQIVHSIIINVGFFVFFKKNSSKKFLLATLYYLLWCPYYNTEILRESYSVLIFLFSYKYLLQKKYTKYYLLSLFALLWHVSALFLFAVPILYNIFNKIDNMKAISLIFIVSLSAYFILNYMFSQSLLSILMQGGIDRLEATLDSGGLNINGILFTLFVISPAFLLLYRFTRRKEQVKRNTILLYIFVALIGITFIPIQRLVNYFTFFYLMLIVEAYAETVGKKYHSLYKISIIFILLIRMKSYFTELDQGFHKYDLYLPYHSVFDPKEEIQRETFIINEFLN